MLLLLFLHERQYSAQLFRLTVSAQVSSLLLGPDSCWKDCSCLLFEIDKFEAEANAEVDRKAKEEADKVNQADSLIFQTEKQLKEFGDKIPADKKSNIEGALTTLKTAHQSRDLNGIDTAMETLNAAWAAASEDMYKASQDAPQNEAPNQSQSNETQNAEVTDVDFEEVK